MLANEGSQWEMTYNAAFLCSHLGKSIRLTCTWKGKHMTAALNCCNRIWLAVSLEMPVTSLMKGRKLPGSPSPCASKSNPGHLQCRIWQQCFILQWKAEISNHTSDRPRELGYLSASCRIFGGLFVFLKKICSVLRYCSVTVLTVTYAFFPCNAKASKPNFSACQGIWCGQQSPIAHKVTLKLYKVSV